MRSFNKMAVAGLVALMVLGTVPAASATPLTFTDSGGISYSADSGNVGAGATVTGYASSSMAVSIPATVTINGTSYDVTSIWNSVFENTGVASVTIPNSVTSIGSWAFAGNNLISVTIPGSVTSIGQGAFTRNRLASVTISDGVTSIGDSAFSFNSLTSVTIPNSVTSIATYAFDSNALTSVTISDSVTSIMAGAFSRNHLTSVTIPEGVTSIGAYAFFGSRLSSVTIPNSVASIGAEAFDGNSLTSVQFLGAAPVMGEVALGTVSGLEVSYFSRYGGFTTPTWNPVGTSSVYTTNALAQVTYDTNGGSTGPAQATVTVGNTVTQPAAPIWTGHTFTGWHIAATGFAWDFREPVNQDTTLDAQWVVDGPISFTDYVSGISYSAYIGNVGAGATVTGYTSSSTAVSIPATVTIYGTAYDITSIGSWAFAGHGLTSVTIPDSVTSIGDGAFYGHALTSVTIPDSVTSIGEYAFAANALTSVTIPNSVTSIGSRAFYGNQIALVQFLGAAPTTIGAEALSSSGAFISYLPQYGSSLVAGGFTSPTWTPAGTSDIYSTWALATVTFDTSGGNTAPAPDAVNSDGTVTRPADPTWASHTFTGWFTAATGGTAWNFTRRVNVDATLYAQWTSDAPPVVTPPVTDRPVVTPPVTDRPVVTPPVTYHPVLIPPVTDQSVLIPPVTDQSVLVPPLVGPSVTAAPSVILTVDLSVGSPLGKAPVTVSGSGMLPNSPWTLVLHSTPKTVASGTTTGDGAFTGMFNLPASISSGSHTLTLTGRAPDGSTVAKVVYLTVSSSGALSYLSTQNPPVSAATGLGTTVFGLVSLALLLMLGALLIFFRRRRKGYEAR